MLSQLTTLVLDSTDQLQTAGTGIYNRRVFFKDSAGVGVSIQEMHAQNALATKHKNSDSPDVVYLLYALITCQMWILVSRFVDQNAQLKIGMSVIHIYMCSYQLQLKNQQMRRVNLRFVCDRCNLVIECIYVYMYVYIENSLKFCESIIL